MTAAHHVVHWIHGGSTDLDNLILLFHRHHWVVHEGGWQIIRSDDGHLLTIPPTLTFGPSPRGPDQLLPDYRGGSFSQDEFLDLACCRLRQLLDEGHAVRCFEMREALPA